MPTAKRRKIPQQVLEQAATVHTDVVTALWELWRGVHTAKNGRGNKLNPKRVEDISVAVIAYGFEACVRAIIGSYFSPWHMGDNPAQKRYTSIHLVLRYGEQWRVAKFGKLYQENLQDAQELRRQHGTLVNEVVERPSISPTVVEEVVEAK
jgi:hypothetical protein